MYRVENTTLYYFNTKRRPLASVSNAKKKKKCVKNKNFTQNIRIRRFITLLRSKKMEKSNTQTLSFLTTGAFIGGINGLFGGGGGMLAVPLLGRVGYKEKQAHATAILVILPICFSSFLFYFFRGFYDFSVLIPTSIGVSLGGIVGARLLNILPEKKVKILFALLQFLSGVYLFFS